MTTPNKHLRNFFGWSLFMIITLTASLVSAAVPAEPAQDKIDSTEELPAAYNIGAIGWRPDSEKLTLQIRGDAPPTYTMYELFDPMRVIIDIADAAVADTVTLPLDLARDPVKLVKVQVLKDKKPYIARLVLFIEEDSSYAVDRNGNDIDVQFVLNGTDLAQGTTSTSNTVVSVTKLITTTTLSRLSAEIAEQDTDEESPVPPLSDTDLSSIREENDIINEGATVLFDIEISHQPTSTLVYLKGDGVISEFEKVQLSGDQNSGQPAGMYLDIDGVKLAGPDISKEVGTALANTNVTETDRGIRVFFSSGLDRLFDYTIQAQPDGLLVSIAEPSAPTAVIAGLVQESAGSSAKDPEVAPAPEIITPPDQPVDSPEIDAIIDSALQKELGMETAAAGHLEPIQPVVEGNSRATETKNDEKTETDKAGKSSRKTANRPNDFAFAGYTKQRITVDFYKIDLHNVFRLFGEVSNLNMVVDESVKGNLTLALNDVPWDFALDIILNLKDLQKEERFNTIVISPKSKKFNWPERSLDTLEFKADLEIIETQDKESIQIKRREEVSPVIVEAKKLIHQAQRQEKEGNYQEARELYENAFSKWPKNLALAQWIASLCLVKTGNNAKAVHYAKAGLQIQPGNQNSALQAAIGLARMQKADQARKYFEMSVSGSSPTADALSSYAAFCEQNEDYDCTMTLLSRHEELHGDSLATMISRARVYDKLGSTEKAVSEYQAILLSGYDVPADLKRFIKGRIAIAQ